MSSKTRPHHQGKPVKYEKGELPIAPKDLTIVWGGDARYWNLPKNDEPAELYQVSWLEVTGCVYETNSKMDYEVGFELSLNPDAFGWGSAPVFIMAKRGKKGKFWANKGFLGADKERMTVTLKCKGPADEVQGQMKVGVVSREDALEDAKVYFGLYEVWSGKWKGGMKIHKAFIKELQPSQTPKNS